MNQIAQLPQKKLIAEELRGILANTYTLYIKTHGYHWNVESPYFATLHALFETQYTELWQALDIIAERIRMLDEYAPRNTQELAAGSTIQPETGMPDASQMLSHLVKDNQTVIDMLKSGIITAQKAGDEVTAGLFIERQTIHEKALWMLHSTNKSLK